MIEVYDEIFNAFKNYVEENSEYNPRIVKYNTNTSTYFPIITCILSDNKDTNYCTIDKIEYYEEFYFTIDIYTKDKKNGNNVVIASQIINDELSRLTMEFFGGKLNMKKTQNKPTPNLDTSILRKTIQYQCLIGNVRENIIRRWKNV